MVIDNNSLLNSSATAHRAYCWVQAPFFYIYLLRLNAPWQSADMNQVGVAPFSPV